MSGDVTLWCVTFTRIVTDRVTAAGARWMTEYFSAVTADAAGARRKGWKR